MYSQFFDPEKIRFIAVSTMSAIWAFISPAHHFIIALIIMFGFNIFCGMKADGVVIHTCKNFSMSKFKNSLCELFLYLLINLVTFSIMRICGDLNAAVIATKTLSYVFMYVYTASALKNLVKVYPKNKALRILYHLFRFEFMRAMPTHVQTIIDRIEEEEKKNTDSNI